jgi:hypothetical protein
LTESLNDEQDEALIEKAIIEAFGYSIIEFETTLFHKYLGSSGPNSLITPSQFKKYLMKMHAKGYLVPLYFHRRKAWKRLIIADFVGQDVILTETSEPIEPEPLIVSAPQENEEQVHEHLVSDCKEIAEEIISTMRLQKQFESDTDQKARALLHEHVRKMHHALTKSRGQFYTYLERNLPDLREPLEQILKSRGEDKVLLGLHVIRGVP